MSSGNVKVSIVIPVYNMGNYLEASLGSARAQTLRDIELICINDGSTDNSEAILNTLAARDSRIRVISHENRGVAAARNEGIAAAAGEYVAFLDPDDLYPAPDVLELLYRKAHEHNVAICGGEMEQFTPESPTPIQNYKGDYAGFLFPCEGRFHYRDYQFDYGFYRFIYSRQLLLEHRIIFPHYTRFQDPPFMVAAFMAAGDFYAISRPTYSYRVEHKEVNWTPQKSADVYQGIYDIWQQASMQHLPRLKRHAWARIREHYPATAHLLTPEQQQFINEVETDQNPQRRTLRYKLFSKDKNFADPRRRALTILGITYIYSRR